MTWMGVGESELPWAGEELVLLPTGAWPEAVGGSGTLAPTPIDPPIDPGGRGVGRGPLSVQCPFLSLYPAPANFPAPSPF